MNFGDNRLKRITRFLYKWFWCSWIHRKHRCYPAVWDKNDNSWHCTECHDCAEGIDMITGAKKFGWL